MIRFTARRMNGVGNRHEHIQQLQWVNPQENQPNVSDVRPTLVDWVQTNPGQACVQDASGNHVDVRVVHAQTPYLQTYADGKWTDNLLALPLF